MRPTTADDNVFDFNALLHPGTVFDHPKDVCAHTGLTSAEKRAILASWASDASAIASCPSMRSPAGLKKPVSIDEILEASVRTGWRSPESSRRQALSVALHRTCHSRVKREGDHARRETGTAAGASKKYRPISQAARNASVGS